MPEPTISVGDDEIRVGDRFSVAFQRTLRIPEDGGVYPLPPGLGRLPVAPVGELGAAVPAGWRERGGVVVPLHQREALWLAFAGAAWKPNAVQVFAGGVNAVSGGTGGEGLAAEPQNYLVCPDQPWLDGVNAGAGFVRQFVALPLGGGRTVEGRLTGREELGGIQLRVYEPQPGRFPEHPPEPDGELPSGPQRSAALGLGAGGRVRQKIYPDPYGLETWDTESCATVWVHLLNGEQYRGLTGRDLPPTPVDVSQYTQHGLPWFELYDEDRGDLPASSALVGIEGAVEETEAGVRPESGQIRPIGPLHRPPRAP